MNTTLQAGTTLIWESGAAVAETSRKLLCDSGLISRN